MKVAKPVIVPLTREHLIEWHGEEAVKHSFKGVAAFVNDKLVCVAGVQILRGHVVAFYDVDTDASSKYKLTIHKEALKLMKKLKERHIRIIATADTTKHPNAEKWLSSLGFVKQSEGHWKWQ